MAVCAGEEILIDRYYRPSPLLETCQQIRDEAMGFYFTSNDIHFVVHDMDLRNIPAWLRFRGRYEFWEGRNIVQLTESTDRPGLETSLDQVYMRNGADMYLSLGNPPKWESLVGIAVCLWLTSWDQLARYPFFAILGILHRGLRIVFVQALSRRVSAMRS